jgi:hypothetical protein
MKRMTLSGGMQFDRLEGVEVYALDIGRQAAGAGSSPGDLKLVGVLLGSETRHVIIHDVHNVGWWSSVKGGLLYNALVYNIGWQSVSPDDPRPGGGHGHPLYCQNDGTSVRRVEGCVLVAGMASTAGKVYAEGTDNCRSVHLRDTVFVGARFIAGGVRHAADDIAFDGCTMLGGHIQMGYHAQNGRGSVTNCLIDGGFALQSTKGVPSWRAFTFTGNTVIGGEDRRAMVFTSIAPGWTWDENTYYTRVPGGRCFLIENVGWLTLSEWRARTGYDLNSRVILGDPPAQVRIYPVEGAGSHLANIAISNPARTETVDIDLSAAGVQRGVRCRLVNALDPSEAGQQFVWHGAPVTVRMTGLGTAAVRGWSADVPPPGIPRTVYPRYGVFRLEVMDTQEVIMALQEQISAAIAALTAAQTAIAEKDTQIARLEAEVQAAQARDAQFQQRVAAVAAAAAIMRQQVALIDTAIGGGA